MVRPKLLVTLGVYFLVIGFLAFGNHGAALDEIHHERDGSAG